MAFGVRNPVNIGKEAKGWDWYVAMQSEAKSLLAALPQHFHSLQLQDSVSHVVRASKNECDGHGFRLSSEENHNGEMFAQRCECLRRARSLNLSIARSLVSKVLVVDSRSRLADFPEISWHCVPKTAPALVTLCSTILAPQLNNFAFDEWKCELSKFVKRAQCLHHFFYSPVHFVVSWDEVQQKIDKQDYFEELKNKMAPGRVAIVDFGEIVFRVKAGANPELTQLETFVSLADQMDCSLVALSSQELLPSKRSGVLDFDYGSDARTSYRDADNKLRFTSTKAAAAPAMSLRECLKQGTFDRLISLLQQGQDFLDKLRSQVSAH